MLLPRRIDVRIIRLERTWGVDCALNGVSDRPPSDPQYNCRFFSTVVEVKLLRGNAISISRPYRKGQAVGAHTLCSIVHGISRLMVTSEWPLVLLKLSLKGKAIEQVFNGFKMGVRIDLLLSPLLPLESWWRNA